MNIFFFDLDGTIRQSKSGATFISKPDDQQPIPGAEKAVKYYSDRGFLCIGITNQSGVAVGHKLLVDAIAEQQITLNLFPELLCIYMCPDFDGNHCWLITREFDAKSIHTGWGAEFSGEFRKLGPGMVKAAILNHHGYGIPEDCWMVGDRPEDFECAKSAGINGT